MIITADELQASPEAVEAGVDGLEDPVVATAIRVAEAVMNKALGFRVANDAESISVVGRDGDRLWLPERVRTVDSVTDSYLGTTTTLDEDYEIRESGFALYRRGGWQAHHTYEITGEFGYEPYEDIESVWVGDDQYLLGQRFVLLYAVRMLASTGSSEMPAPPGAVLTGDQSEGAAFQFYTPTGDSTGYQDLDNLLNLIGKHPNRSQSLYTISVQREPIDADTRLDFPFERGRL